MASLTISVACGRYDRTAAVLDGRVGIEGCEVIAHGLPPEETFFRAFRGTEFDVAELSFSTFAILTAQDACPYVGVPAFLSRAFRHNSIYLRQDSPIRHPSELKGKRVGVPEYQVTAAVWVRAFLEDDYGIKPSDVTWVTGGVEEAGRHEKVRIALADDVRVGSAGEGKTLAGMLLSGEIDALTCPRAPNAYGSGSVRRLFDDPLAVAEDYFARTGHFPIMHLLGIRRELAELHPWLPGSVYKAFLRSRDLATAALDETAALSLALPFMPEQVERTRRVMGNEFWRYGARENRSTIDYFLDQHHRQGLSSRRLALTDVFHPGGLEQFKI